LSSKRIPMRAGFSLSRLNGTLSELLVASK
jgi:hypothetical protein